MNAQELKSELESKFPGGILSWEERSPHRVYAAVKPESLREMARHLYAGLGLRLSTATAAHILKGFEILYHFALDRGGVVLSLRVSLGEGPPAADSIADLVPAADWIEREMAELMGVEFRGRASTEPLLSSEEWPKGVFPLRKNGEIPDSGLQIGGD